MRFRTQLKDSRTFSSKPSTLERYNWLGSDQLRAHCVPFFPGQGVLDAPGV